MRERNATESLSGISALAPIAAATTTAVAEPDDATTALSERALAAWEMVSVVCSIVVAEWAVLSLADAHKLFLVATNLDTGASVTFGKPGHDHVPITKAIEASAALPGLFPPVEIDGEHYVDGALNKTLHASVALDAGVSLLFCINPLVPFNANVTPRKGGLTVEKLNLGGLPLVLAQTFRAIVHSRMKVGMEKYRRQYPHADILLFEPGREDADMFFANIFSYAHRQRLCAAAYQTTRQSLLARRATLEPQLAKQGIRLNVQRLYDQKRAIDAAINDPRPLRTRPRGVRQTTRDLSHTLDHLQRWLAAAR